MNNQVILYSGGLDSVILAAQYPDAQRVYFDMGTRYAQQEMARLPEDVIIDRTFNFADVERDDAIVPSRNLYLVTRAADYAHNIYMAVTSGDSIKDKDADFFRQAQALLNHMNDSWYGTGQEIYLHTPLKKLSKSQAIAEYLENEGNPQALLDSFSCYTPDNGLQCGACKCCVRKFAALAANNIDSLKTFASAPIFSKAWQIELETDRRGQESTDIKLVNARIHE